MQVDFTTRLTTDQIRRIRRLEKGLAASTPAKHAARARYEAKRVRPSGKSVYAKNKAFVDHVKLTLGCMDCGYRANAVALQFDHRPGTAKVGGIAKMVLPSSMNVLCFEMQKCDVVCANCHAVRTHARRHDAMPPHQPAPSEIP